MGTQVHAKANASYLAGRMPQYQPRDGPNRADTFGVPQEGFPYFWVAEQARIISREMTITTEYVGPASSR